MFFVPQNRGEGASKGVEFELEKKASPNRIFSGFVSYAFSDSKYRDSSRDRWIPFKFDRRHSLTLFANVRVGGNWRVNLLWQTASGLPFTDVLGYRLESDFGWEFVRGLRNEANLPFFHRVDARIGYQRRVSNRELTFYLDFINVMDRKNIYDIIWEKDLLEKDGRTVLAAKKRTFFMLPFVPSFGISLKL